MTEQEHQAKLRKLHLIEEARLTLQRLYTQGAAVMGTSIQNTTGQDGKSVLMSYLDTAQDEWFLICAVWPQTQPASAPYLSTPIATGVSGAEWDGTTIRIIESGGYTVSITDDINNTRHIFFIDGVGTLIDSTIITGSWSLVEEEGLFTGVTYVAQPSSLATAKLWSGGQVFTHTFSDATASPSWNASGVGGDDCTLDGTTTLRYDSANGEQTWMLNAITGTKHNITQHLVHSNSVGPSTNVADGFRMYGNYLWILFRPQAEIQAPIVSTQQGSNQVTVVDFMGAEPGSFRPGQEVTSAQFPQGTVVAMVMGNTLTLSQPATATQATATMGLSGDFVDLLRIIKTDGTVTDIDLSDYNLRGFNEVRAVGRYDLVIDAVQALDNSTPGWVIVYRGQDEVLLDRVVNLQSHTNFSIISGSDPKEFRTGYQDPSGIDYVTMMVHTEGTWNGKMYEYEELEFIWYGPDSETLCTWNAAFGAGSAGLYYNSVDQPNQRQLAIVKLVNGEPSLLTFGLDTNLCDAIVLTLPTDYANMTGNFLVRALGPNHAIVSWEDTSRPNGEIRAYRIWNRLTMEWNGQILWLNPTGAAIGVYTSGSTLLINDTIGNRTFYWVPAINNGNAGINILTESSFTDHHIVNEGFRGISSYPSGFAQSGVILVIMSNTEAWLIKNQLGQTATWINLTQTQWGNTIINYDLIAVANEVDDLWQINVLNMNGTVRYTINTEFPNLVDFRTIGNRVLARVGDGTTTRLYFISAHSAIFRDVTAYQIGINDWRLDQAGIF